MLQRFNRFLRTNSRKPLTCKSIGLFVIVTWTLRYVVVAIYCLFLHNLIFRFTSCPTEQYWPKNFSDIEAITYSFEPTACDQLSTTDSSIIQIVVFIPVHVSRFERRNTIRETWAKPFKDGIRIRGKKLVTKLIFVTGSVQSIEWGHDREETKKIDERLREESSVHDDILQVANVIDSYYNITLKIRSVLEWSQKKCPRAVFTVRADSDIVLDYSSLLKFLFWLSDNHATGANASGDGIIAGYCRPYDCVTRWPTSKTCLPRPVYQSLQTNKYDTSSFLPRYCFGFSYVLSTRFVARALKIWSRDTATLSKMRITPEIQRILYRYWPLDDIFLTGYIAEALDSPIPRFNHPHTFTYRIKFDSLPCSDSGVVASGAYEDEAEMKRRWSHRQHVCPKELIL